jgi:hypothetical protein
VTRSIWLDPTTGGRRHLARRIDITPGRYCTHITLDRDEYVYTARQDGRGAEVELPDAFTAALHRCLDAASDYLWVQGYPGGFQNFAGPSLVTLDVPFPMADQAAAALRAAEMDGDYSGLGALTAELTVPLDEWLGPGERELRRGVDFTASPTAFLKFLRAKADQRGLRLNGRAVPGAVWVHPQMPATAAELRSRYPDRFGHYPDPTAYAGHADEEDTAYRPYVGARSEAPRPDATPIVFLPASRPSAAEPCACGYPGAETDDNDPRHAQGHMQWSTGVLIPRNLDWPGGSIAGDIAVVTATSPVGWRKLAYACALLPRRENHYDFASFAVGDGKPAEDNLRAYLYRAGRRVVGFVSVFDATRARWYPDPIETSEAVPQPTDGHLRPVVNVIFTAAICDAAASPPSWSPPSPRTPESPSPTSPGTPRFRTRVRPSPSRSRRPAPGSAEPRIPAEDVGRAPAGAGPPSPEPAAARRLSR